MKNKNLLLVGIIILGFVVTTFAQTVPAYVPKTGLVGWWPFTGNANDESGLGNNGIVNGATLTTDRFGIANSAYSFNGMSNFIEVLHSSTLSFEATGQSISFWIKLPSIPSNNKENIIFQKQSGQGATTKGFQLIISNYNNANLILERYQNAVIAGWEQTSIPFSLIKSATWYHIVFVTDNENFKSYFNGTLINTTPIKAGSTIGANTANLRMGSSLSGTMDPLTGGSYNGILDDISIYNRALNQQEITNLHIGCSTPPTSTITAESSTTFCQGGFVNLKANTGSGYTYQWYNNGNEIVNATNSSYIVSQSGNYTVKVTDGLCDATSSAVSVTVNANPSNVVTASGATTFCSGNSVTLTAQGTGSYLWSNGATTKQITVNQTGNYFVVVTANGCSSTSSTINVVVKQTPTATITASGATTFCQGGFVTLKASGGDTYQWNTGATTASINAMQSSTYSVIVTSNGCSATASQLVTVNPNPSVSLAQPENFININANPLTLYGSPSGGTYSGSGVSGSTFNPKAAGLGKSTISYSYTNSSGCITTATQSTIVYDTTGVVCATHINVTDTLFIDTYVTGVTPPKNLNTIKVFPNPAKDYITINYGNFASMNGYSIKITNSLGQVVFTTPINQQSSYIDLSKWRGNGVYFVNIIDKLNNTIETRKIVLQ